MEYDSELEKNILLDLDKCSFIKEIKTQSLIVPYPAKFGKKMHKYIPDIQLLLEDGAIVIIEVKPFKEMVNGTVIRKTKALRKYCKEHHYGHIVLDKVKNKKYYSFENLKKEKVSEDIQFKFIDYVKERKELTISKCKDFEKANNINEFQLCYILWRKRKYIKYLEHKITLKKWKKL